MSPTHTDRLREDESIRFWSKVNKTDTCWLWTGAVDIYGYGKWARDNKSIKPHRLSYEIHKGFIPKGLVVDHLCRVRNCINPEHLRVVTSRENILSGVGVSAKNIKKTHCKKGHKFTSKNTYISHSKGDYPSRNCLTCKRESWIKDNLKSSFERHRKQELEEILQEIKKLKGYEITITADHLSQTIVPMGRNFTLSTIEEIIKKRM